MRISRTLVVFDAPDLGAESAFWAKLLGGTVDADDDWHTVRVDGEDRVAVQLAPDHVPPRWPDGTYSVQGTASALGITAQTVFDWLRNGRLAGRQLAKGQPWQIAMSDDQISALRVQVRRTSRSKQEAS